MASFHFEIKSGRKGAAEGHSVYIVREGWHRHKEDLVSTGHGNLPLWTHSNPTKLWKASDKYERINGSTYREMVIALPAELNGHPQQALVDDLVSELAGPKAYQYAVHAPTSSIQGEINTHLHLMISDRMPDGIMRTEDQTFRRYNAADPTQGGCKKDGGGKTRMQLRDQLIGKRKRVAEIQNEHLAMHGHDTSVDHRTLKAQGVQREAERHLGPARIRHMTAEERAGYVAERSSTRQVEG